MPSNPTLATAAFRLSSQQERMWLGHERGLQEFAQCVIRIVGPLDVKRLKGFVQSSVEKYEILRTVLRRQTGVKLPFQVIRDEPVFSWAEASADARLDDLLKSERVFLADT